VDIFVSKEEEKALRIDAEVTDLYRREYNIPDTGGLLEMREELLREQCSKRKSKSLRSFVRELVSSC
jgi:hypothetical protein